MEEIADYGSRNGSAMSIHMAVINREAAEKRDTEQGKRRQSRRSASKSRQKKMNKIKLPRLTFIRKEEIDLLTPPSLNSLSGRRQTETFHLDKVLDSFHMKAGLKLHHCSDHLLEESLKESSLRQNFQVLYLNDMR